MSDDRIYAHTLPNQPEERWEPLAEHLENVAELASRFAAAFGAEAWGEPAGLWHDLGKYKPEFQARLRTALTRRAVPLEGFFGNGSLLRPLDESLGKLSQLLEREEAIISITELDTEHFLSAHGRRDVHVTRWTKAYAQPAPAEASVNPAAVIRHAFPLSGARETRLLDFGDPDHEAPMLHMFHQEVSRSDMA